MEMTENLNESKLTDKEELINYYNSFYCSQEYKDYIHAKEMVQFCQNEDAKGRKRIGVYARLLLAVIWLWIFISAKNGFYEFGIAILIPLAFIIRGKITNKNNKKSSDKWRCWYNEYSQNVNKLKSKLKVPPLPDDKLNPQTIKELIDVFESGRADTYKEALIINEQDRQHRELMNRQRALEIEAENARRQTREAEEKAEALRKEADYQRREAEYWREEEYYNRQQDDYYNNR